MHTPTGRHWAHHAVLALLLASLAAAAQASDKAQTGRKASDKPQKIVFIDAPSGESPAAREKRLRRECKGRPNAGMCLGLTR